LSALSPAERRAIFAAKIKKERELFYQRRKQPCEDEKSRGFASTNADRILECLGASPSNAQKEMQPCSFKDRFCLAQIAVDSSAAKSLRKAQ
jgi:hypothetical protein